MKSLLFLLIVAAPLSLCAQRQPVVIDIAYTHDNPGIPFLNTPIGPHLYPGYRIGTEIQLTRNSLFNLLLNFYTSGSFHRASAYGNVFRLGSNVVGRLELPFGLYFDGVLGLSYVHVFSDIPYYNATATAITPTLDYGRPNLGADLGLRIGFAFRRNFAPVRVFLGADAGFTYAFSPGDFMIIPTTTLVLGISVPVGGRR